jgi:hypothetical protein
MNLFEIIIRVLNVQLLFIVVIWCKCETKKKE